VKFTTNARKELDGYILHSFRTEQITLPS